MLWKHTVTGARRYSAAKICDGKILSLSFSLAQFIDIGRQACIENHLPSNSKLFSYVIH